MSPFWIDVGLQENGTPTDATELPEQLRNERWRKKMKQAEAKNRIELVVAERHG